MRARSAIIASLASGAILLIGWQAGNQPTTLTGAVAPSTAPPATAPDGTGPAPSATPSSAPAPSAPVTPAAPSGVAAGTFTGSQIQTPYGTVQVKAEIAGGRITDVIALQMTDQGSTSMEIDQQAVPMLRSEVLSSQSAHVDMVSGATYTTEGYLTSLQAALDAAHFTR
ncbi:MAG: FMN-binding protein [Microbacteriaceae bacterium]